MMEGPDFKEVAKKALDIIASANRAIQYIEPKLPKEDEDIFMDFHIKLNQLFMEYSQAEREAAA